MTFAKGTTPRRGIQGAEALKNSGASFQSHTPECLTPRASLYPSSKARATISDHS